MVRCPNCGQKTSGDYCQWCRYPILGDSTTRRRKAEKRAKVEARKAREAERKAREEAKEAERRAEGQTQRAAREQARREAEEAKQATEVERKAREGAKKAIMRAFVPVLCLLGLASAEWITAGVHLTGGLIFHLIIFFCLILYASLTAQYPDHKLYLSLSLAPLIRILSLSMPLAGFSQTYWYLIAAIPVLIGAFIVIRLLNFRTSEIGLSLRQSPLQVLLQGVVALTGIGFGLVEYRIFTPEPLVPVLTWGRLWLPGFILLVATGFTEELVFRGVIQRSSMEVLGTGGLFYTAAVFSVFHIGYLSWMHYGFVFLAGLFFGWVVKRTGSIVGVSLSHGISNIGLYLVFPFVAY